MLLLVSERPLLRDLPARTLLRAGIFTYRASYENAGFLYREKDVGGAVLDGKCTETTQVHVLLVLCQTQTNLFHKSLDG